MTNSAPMAAEQNEQLQQQLRDHLWMHFTPIPAATVETPVFVSGEGSYLYDSTGKRYLDALAALFTVQVGHGRTEILEAAARQGAELAYFPVWGAATIPAVTLAARLAALAPGDLNRVFFGTGGGDSVESAWKFVRQYFQLVGKPTKTKVLARDSAYHGTSMGALSITQVDKIKQPFGPLVPDVVRVPSTDLYRAGDDHDDPEAYGQWAADAVEQAILAEGAETVAAFFIEPVQNSGGILPPPPGYLQRVEEICRRHDVLLVSDETICGFGRTGSMFGCQHYGFQPDIITCAKGLTSGYAILSAMIVSDRLAEPFIRNSAAFDHGNTWGGHPAACAAALENLNIIEREQLVDRVAETSGDFLTTLNRLCDLPWVGDIRGVGYLWGIELVLDRATRAPLTSTPEGQAASRKIVDVMRREGLHARAFSNGSSVIQLCPPLIAGQTEFDEIERVLRQAIVEAMAEGTGVAAA